MKTSLKYLLGATAMIAVFGLAGCGEKSSSNAPSNAGSNSSTGKVLKVGTDATFQPFEWRDENGNYTGFDIDLMNAVSKKMGYDHVEYVNTDFKGLIPGLMSKKFDVIASAMYVTDDRKKTIAFSDTYYPGGLCIMIRKDTNTINDIDDLKGKTVAVQVGTKSAKYLAEKYPEVNRLEVETNNEMFLSLESSKADAVVTGKPAAEAYSKKSGKVKILSNTLTNEQYAYGLRKEDTTLLSDINKALKEVKADGEYDKIKGKYF